MYGPDHVIKFYRINDEYGDFSNFAPYPIWLDNKLWKTTEHYFQAMKFTDKKKQEKIRAMDRPKDAAVNGRKWEGLRDNWEWIKESVMKTALRAKFDQHPKLRELLFSTGSAKIVEHTARDSFGGDGGDGTGRNALGRLLVELREEYHRILDEKADE